MQLHISREAAYSAVFSSIVARMFLSLMLDAPSELHNGAWLSALLGALPVLIWLLWEGYAPMYGCPAQGTVNRVFILVLLMACLSDSAHILSMLVRSAAYYSPDHVSDLALAVPLCLVMLWCISRNGDAIGYGATLFIRLFPLFLLPVILLQARHLKPEWLCPLLGGGFSTIAGSASRLAGAALPASAVLFLSDISGNVPGKPSNCRLIRLWAATTAVTCALLLLSLMMTPSPGSGVSRMYRLDALLTNGRAPLYLQLPMISMWYTGLLQLLAVECFSSAALLQRFACGLDGRAAALLTVFIVVFIWIFPLPGALSGSDFQVWSFAAVALIAALHTLTSLAKKGGQGKCAS